MGQYVTDGESNNSWIGLISAHILSLAALLGIVFIIWINQPPALGGQSDRRGCELAASAVIAPNDQTVKTCQFFEAQYFGALDLLSAWSRHTVFVVAFLTLLQCVQLALVISRRTTLRRGEKPPTG
jgi:hypothetical protein